MKLNKFLLVLVLAPLSWMWGGVTAVRGWMFRVGWLRSRSFDVPLICVGNLAVGGTGKTPHVEYILRLLHKQGYRVAMLSRGYGRHTKGYVLGTSQTIATEMGDEPYQVMHNCPFAQVAVCEKRVEGVERLLHDVPDIDVIVLDDAYQHRYIRAGLNILLTEAHRLYTHDHLLPWGRLRESPSAARRAQIVVVTKCEAGEYPPLEVLPLQRLYYSRITYSPLQPAWIEGKVLPMDEVSSIKSQRGSSPCDQVLLIAGIANPAPLACFLEKKALKVTTLEFRDHHDYTSADAQHIAEVWGKGNYAWAITTQKDEERLRTISHLLPQKLRDHLLVQPITVSVEAASDQEISFNQSILQYVRANQRNRSVD